MKLSLPQLSSLIKKSIDAWIDDRASTMGAALAYYTAFSLSPLLLVIIAAGGLFVDESITQQAILRQFSGLIGDDGARFVRNLLQSAQHKDSGIISIAISAVTLFIGATSVFAELENDLNHIWRVGKPPVNSLLHFAKTRFLSFGLVLAVGFLLTVSLLLSTAVNALATLFGSWYQSMAYLLEIGNFLISFGAITVLFALIYKLLPDVKIALSDVWIGAISTALLFALGKYFIGLYLGRSAISSSFGAAGTFIVLMVWIYYSAQIFLLGAEFTYVYASHFGSLSGGSGKRPVAATMATPKPHRMPTPHSERREGEGKGAENWEKISASAVKKARGLARDVRKRLKKIR